MINIYVLKCEQDKYFVGKISNKHIFKFKNFNPLLYDFTIKYKPLHLHKFIENVDIFEFDKFVKKYMNKYGIANVRGGSYLDIDLSESQTNTLQAELWTIQNKCYLCGDAHTHKECPHKLIIENSCNNKDYIYINKNEYRNPVMIQTYICYIGCCVCGKNAVGRVSYTKFDYLITSPSYLDNNSNIKKLAICEICSSDIIGKSVIDTDKKKYLIRGLENGQDDS